jgi:hypothetical protein
MWKRFARQHIGPLAAVSQKDCLDDGGLLKIFQKISSIQIGMMSLGLVIQFILENEKFLSVNYFDLIHSVSALPALIIAFSDGSIEFPCLKHAASRQPR